MQAGAVQPVQAKSACGPGKPSRSRSCHAAAVDGSARQDPDYFHLHGFGPVVRDLAGSSGVMAATAVTQADGSDVDGRTAIEDRLADREDRVLLLHAPHDVNRDVAFGEQGIDDEAVAGVDHLFVAKIDERELAVDRGAAANLLGEPLAVGHVEVDALLHVGKRQHLLDRVFAALLDELHHQVVVRNPEVAEPAKAGPGVHQEIEQHPALRIEDLVAGELRRIGLINRRHEFGGDRGKVFAPP